MQLLLPHLQTGYKIRKERQYPTISVSNSVFARPALASYYGDICQHLVSCFIPCSNYFSYKSALAFPIPCKEAPCASQIFEGYCRIKSRFVEKVGEFYSCLVMSYWATIWAEVLLFRWGAQDNNKRDRFIFNANNVEFRPRI